MALKDFRKVTIITKTVRSAVCNNVCLVLFQAVILLHHLTKTLSRVNNLTLQLKPISAGKDRFARIVTYLTKIIFRLLTWSSLLHGKYLFYGLCIFGKNIKTFQNTSASDRLESMTCKD